MHKYKCISLLFLSPFPQLTSSVSVKQDKKKKGLKQANEDLLFGDTGDIFANIPVNATHTKKTKGSKKKAVKKKNLEPAKTEQKQLTKSMEGSVEGGKCLCCSYICTIMVSYLG